jgi:nicotinamidase-related amidase
MSDSHQVLLVMDYQHANVEGLGTPELIAAASRAIDAARAKDIPVMFVRVAFRPGSPEVAASNKTFSGVAANAGEAMWQESQGTQIHASVAPLPSEPVIVKRRISAFAGSDLDVLLRGAGAETLVMLGLTTSGVILSTLRQAADLDYRSVVLSDACADPDEKVQDVLLGTIFPRQATVTTADEWIAGL